jgi:type III secretion protein L
LKKRPPSHTGELIESPLIIRREVMRARETAQAMHARAAHEAELMRQEARRVSLNDRKLGYQEGVEEGRHDAAKLLAETAAMVDQFYAEREQEITKLAFAIAHRIIDMLPPDEQVARVAQAAIAEHRNAAKLWVRVSPADAPALRNLMAEYDTEGRVEIQADETAAPGSCVLIHPRGRSSVGVLGQFLAMMQEVEQAG